MLRKFGWLCAFDKCGRASFCIAPFLMVATAVPKSGMTHRTRVLPPVHIIFGSAAVMQTLRQKVEKVASSGVPIPIQGESGTGKGWRARFSHKISVTPEPGLVKAY